MLGKYIIQEQIKSKTECAKRHRKEGDPAGKVCLVEILCSLTQSWRVICLDLVKRINYNVIFHILQLSYFFIVTFKPTVFIVRLFLVYV